MSKFIIAGCGYIGERLAQRYKEMGANPYCMVRSPEHCQRLVDEGFTGSVLSMDVPPEELPCSLEGSTLFYMIPPPGGGVFDTRARNFIKCMGKNVAPAKIIYMSATSVYSETGGGIVTEISPAEPVSAIGKRRIDAERAFCEYGKLNTVSVIILRVSGIYGPGRLPLMQISNGQPLLKEEESGMSNRIYADDLVSICMAAADKGENGDIYNISDGHPSSMTSYFNLCADGLGYPRQPQVSMEEARQVMSPLMLSYVAESKIVDSSLIFSKLAVQLAYPDMTVGVPAACRQANLYPKG